MQVKVYIAAPYPLRDRAIAIMELIEARGLVVTSRWLKAPDSMCDEHARKDLEDVASADVLLAMNPDGWTDRGTGGRHVELGYALALGKPVLLIGERSNIFHHLSSVVQFSDVADLATELMALGSLYRSTDAMTETAAIAMIVREFQRANAKHKPMNSPHEGYAVIQEEVDELWADVKADRGRSSEAMAEAVQVAAMGLRYIVNLAPERRNAQPESVVAAGQG